MSLRKKFAKGAYFPILLLSGSVLGTLSGRLLSYDNWDMERLDDADQIIEKFDHALEDLLVLEQENKALDAKMTDALLDWRNVSEAKAKYQSNLTELSQRSSEYAKLMLSMTDINEKDFESLATKFNARGFSKYSSFEVDPSDANSLKECRSSSWDAKERAYNYKDLSICIDRAEENKFFIPITLGVLGFCIFGIGAASFGTSERRRRWIELPDKPKQKSEKTAKHDRPVACLKRRLGLYPKRPGN
jgi:hypothetical protein